MGNNQPDIDNKKKQPDSTNNPTTNSNPKPEQKPFSEFISEHFIPGLYKALTDAGITPETIVLEKGSRPVTGDECWMVIGQIPGGRRFWLCFNTDKISSNKTVAIAENGSFPSDLESFLIDEKRTTCALLISRLLQRLNGQKWLGAN